MYNYRERQIFLPDRDESFVGTLSLHTRLLVVSVEDVLPTYGSTTDPIPYSGFCKKDSECRSQTLKGHTEKVESGFKTVIYP